MNVGATLLVDGPPSTALLSRFELDPEVHVVGWCLVVHPAAYGVEPVPERRRIDPRAVAANVAHPLNGGAPTDVDAPEVISLESGKNRWRAPDWSSVHGIQLEGPEPPKDQLARMQEEVRITRDAWRPDADAWVQLGMIRHAAAGRRIVAKIWHPFIVALDESEGPHWIKALCDAVDVRTDDAGVSQAYLRLRDVGLVETSSGWDAREQYLAVADEPGIFWLNLGDLYELQVIRSRV